MIESNFTFDAANKAEMNFKKIQEAIKGLYEILSLNFSDSDKGFYLEIGEDNIMGLYQNLIELLTNDYGLRQFTKKINRSEIDLDIVLNELEAQEFLEYK
ncbi:MAG: hypothetical protein ACFFAS_08785 [Promethearchaeota archaeon]